MAKGGVRSLVRRLDSVPEPLALFAQLCDNGRKPHTVLLESAEPTSRQTQRSLLVLSSALQILCRGELVTVRALNSNGRSLLPYLYVQMAGLSVHNAGDHLLITVPRAGGEGNEQERLMAPSSLEVLRRIARSLRPEMDGAPEAVFLTGVFAYDLVDQFEPLPEAAPGNDFPDYVFYLADQLFSVDHLGQHAHLVVNVFGGEFAIANYNSAVQAVSAITEACRGLGARSEVSAKERRDPLDELRAGPGAQPRETNVTIDRSDAAFEQMVETMKRHIVAGDVFQIVPSRTYSMPCADPLAAYRALRELNPSPYMFYVNSADFVLLGASPESAVKVDGKSRMVEISPVAGTRGRGVHPDGSPDADLDSRLEAELRLDRKENAEHMMLVDLARNDVARVSKPGTRYVADLLRVVRYSHVMHLVSKVRGELRDGLDALHAYQASMNMGTLTGAPKIRAMQLLRQYEGARRGHYGGAVGYWSGDGSFDTAIVIRAALVKDGVAHVRAGAGVVHDSVPALEAEETTRKAAAVVRAASSF
jgi:anthranilate synthase component 1